MLWILAVDGIEPHPIRESLRELGGTTKLAVDAIKYDESIIKAVRYACDNVIICNTLGEATKLSVKAKVVTLKGAVLTKSDKNAARWNEKEVSEVRTKLKRLQERKSKLETDFAGIDNRRRSGRMGPVQQDLLTK